MPLRGVGASLFVPDFLEVIFLTSRFVQWIHSESFCAGNWIMFIASPWATRSPIGFAQGVVIPLG
ncbi:hypothetical protein WH95_20175, partial [Kiloniella litopenaei]